MLHESQKKQGNFLSIKHGGFCVENKDDNGNPAPAEGFREVEVKNVGTGKMMTKYIKTYSAVDGTIVKVEWYDRDTKYGRFLGVHLHLKDATGRYIVDLPLNSSHYDSFTKVMENIDYARPITLVAFPDKYKENRTVLLFKQDDQNIQWKYTRHDMGDCPEPVQDSFGKWDFKAQREWLYNKLIHEVIPKVDALHAFDEPMPEYADEEAPVAAPVQAKAATAAPTHSGPPIGEPPPEPPFKADDPPEDLAIAPSDEDIPFGLIFAFIGLATFLASMGNSFFA